MSQGKFYEIFEMDASVAADILNLTAMKVRLTVALHSLSYLSSLKAV